MSSRILAKGRSFNKQYVVTARIENAYGLYRSVSVSGAVKGYLANVDMIVTISSDTGMTTAFLEPRVFLTEDSGDFETYSVQLYSGTDCDDELIEPLFYETVEELIEEEVMSAIAAGELKKAE